MRYKKVMAVMILLAILLILAIFSWKQLFSDYRGDVTAKIYQDGKLLETIDLANVTEAYDLAVTNENGGENTVHVDMNGISVSHANCPDQVCVKRGTVFYSDMPIVCMPNKLVIQFQKAEDAGVDNGF